jgi:hypothetical protein
MKSFFDENWRYTEAAIRFDAAIIKAIRPIMDRYITEGYSPREMIALITSTTVELDAEIVLTKKGRL